MVQGELHLLGELPPNRLPPRIFSSGEFLTGINTPGRLPPIVLPWKIPLYTRKLLPTNRPYIISRKLLVRQILIFKICPLSQASDSAHFF